MSTETEYPLEAWMKPGRDAFEYWISFWPVAPMFGVSWRFGDVQPTMPWLPGSTATSKSVKPKAAPKAEVQPEPAPKSTPAAKTAPAQAVKTEVVEKPEIAGEAVVEVSAPAKPKAPRKKVAKKADGPAGLMAKAPATPDDLKLIKGVGPGLEKQLNAMGIYTFAQLSAFKKADLEWVDAKLTSFKGRCFRDDWVAQAKALMA